MNFQINEKYPTSAEFPNIGSRRSDVGFRIPPHIPLVTPQDSFK